LFFHFSFFADFHDTIVGREVGRPDDLVESIAITEEVLSEPFLGTDSVSAQQFTGLFG